MSNITFFVKRSESQETFPFFDGFTGSENAPISTTNWLDLAIGSPDSYDNILLDGNSNAVFVWNTTDDDYSQAHSKFNVSGDFDVSIMFTMPTGIPGYHASTFAFWGQIDGTHFVQALREYNNTIGGQVVRGYAWSGSEVFNNWASYSNTTDVKLRITRTGSTWTSYYWTGSDWSSLGTDSTVGTGNVEFRMQLYSSDNNTPDWTTKVDWFKVETGTIVWP